VLTTHPASYLTLRHCTVLTISSPGEHRSRSRVEYSRDMSEENSESQNNDSYQPVGLFQVPPKLRYNVDHWALLNLLSRKCPGHSPDSSLVHLIKMHLSSERSKTILRPWYSSTVTPRSSGHRSCFNVACGQSRRGLRTPSLQQERRLFGGAWVLAQLAYSAGTNTVEKWAIFENLPEEKFAHTLDSAKQGPFWSRQGYQLSKA
jgi:hypothetical protein